MRVRCRLSMVIRLSISSILYGRDMSRCLTAGCFAWSEKISCSHGSCNCKSLQQASSQMGIPVIPMIFRNFHSYYSIYPTLFQVGLVEASWSKANLRCCRGSTKPCMNCGVEIRLVFCICFLRSNCLNLLGTLGVDRTTQTSTSCLASSPRDPKWQTKALVKVAPTAADKGPMKQLPLVDSSEGLELMILWMGEIWLADPEITQKGGEAFAKEIMLAWLIWIQMCKYWITIMIMYVIALSFFFSKTVGQKKTWPMAGPNYDLSTLQTCLVPLSKGMDHVIIKMND